MTTTEPIYDSPTPWVARHVGEYVETDGARGHRWSGVDTLLLTTRGRQSGKLRRTALIYGRDGAGYVVVGSRGGAPKHPAWYHNLRATPEVQLQVGAEKLRARARTAEGEERDRLWRVMAAIWPQYDAYQLRTQRRIPVVVMEPISES